MKSLVNEKKVETLENFNMVHEKGTGAQAQVDRKKLQ